MGRKYNRMLRSRIILKIVAFPLIIFISYLSIRLGIAAGNFVYDADLNFIESINTESFKTIINRSIPLIETVYNSGNVDISITGEISSATKAIFGFDLNLPLSIFNAQSPLFSSYYRNYQMSIMQDDTENEHGYHRLDYEAENKEEGNKTALNDEQGADYTQPVFQEAVSSISYEETEEKDIDSSDVVSAGKISIRNETKYKIDEAQITKLLREPLKFNFDKKKNKVLIYHSHTTEGYLKNLSELQKSTALNRTRDTRYNVVRAGDELTQQLKKKYGIDVLHNGTIHDYGVVKKSAV